MKPDPPQRRAAMPLLHKTATHPSPFLPQAHGLTRALLLTLALLAGAVEWAALSRSRLHDACSAAFQAPMKRRR